MACVDVALSSLCLKQPDVLVIFTFTAMAIAKGRFRHEFRVQDVIWS